jgi:Ca2+-binding EF-hand superfamily protein
MTHPNTEDFMSNQTYLSRSFVAASVLAGCALSAIAQTAPPATTKDKVAVEAAFARHDANGDGKLSKEELAGLPAIVAKFAELDKNKDGFLSMAEFAAGYTAAS